ncbi:hypothetical protein J2Y58_002808 [Sphingomonas sp. BE138]|nr:hypothetical protein [Sphingomonas sp. BE138]
MLCRLIARLPAPLATPTTPVGRRYLVDDTAARRMRGRAGRS